MSPESEPRRRWLRLRLALGALLFALAILLVAVGLEGRRRALDTETAGVRFPLPAQAAAIVALIDDASAETRSTVLTAVNGDDLRVVLISVEQAAAAAAEADGARFPRLEGVVAAYDEAFEARDVAAYLAVPDGADQMDVPELQASSLWSPYPFRLDVRLNAAEVVRIETRGDLTRRLFNWPLGLGVGLFGGAIAVLALVTVWRETRSIGLLSQALDRFADDADDAGGVSPTPLQEIGPEEARRAIAAFNRLQARVSELLAARAFMLGAVSHDLKTYLTRLRLRLDFIDDSDQRARADADVEQMTEMLDSSLLLARLDAQALRREPTSVGELAAAVRDAHDGLAVEVSAEAAAARVLVDRPLLERAVGNLLENARKYADGGLLSVSIDSGSDAPSIAFAVLDRGPGVGPEEADRLRAAFERGDAARGQGAPGSGLGLAIVDAVARAHGGRFEFGPRPGGGARAAVLLPF